MPRARLAWRRRTCDRCWRSSAAIRRAVPGCPFAFSLPSIKYSREVIKSAIVPVAGVGTRMLPATKSQPKEMLPVARKPIVQYVVEELVQNGIEQILFITGRSKTSIENHFDHDPELVRTLTAANKTDLIQELEFEDLKT